MQPGSGITINYYIKLVALVLQYYGCL